MSRRNRYAKSPPFVMLPKWVIRSAAWEALEPPARCLYLELRERYNGHNNGMIGLGCREAAKAINVGPDTASRALRRLTELGFIEPTTKGQFRTNGRRATEWLLTELPDDRTGHKALKTFASWVPEKTKASPTSRTISPTSRTQTASRATKSALRPTSRTQTAEIVQFASDHKDTSRYTTSPPVARAGEQASPQASAAQRTGRAGDPIALGEALASSPLLKRLRTAGGGA